MWYRHTFKQNTHTHNSKINQSSKNFYQQAGKIAQWKKYLPSRYEPLPIFNPQNPHKNMVLCAGNLVLKRQRQAEPGDFWRASLAYLGSSRVTRDFVSSTGRWHLSNEQQPRLFNGMYIHKHVHVPHTHTQIQKISTLY